MMKRFFQLLSKLLWLNWVTLLGTVLTTVSGSIIVLSIAVELAVTKDKPYTTAMVFLIMPFLFVMGLVMVLVGFLWDRRRRRKGGEIDPLQRAWIATFEDRKTRRRIYFVGIATFLNILIIGTAGYRAMVYMDSPAFCGEVCHKVMQPEYTAYKESPHSRVKCVECHIGGGADWKVRAKITGLEQLWAVAVDSYQRPIPAPIENLRPARETCEECHWPAKFHGDMEALFPLYEDDEANTLKVTALMLKVGGKNPRTGEYKGIHWHVSPHVQVRYEVLDRERQRIGKVTWLQDGVEKEVFSPKEKEDLPVLEVRTMDCIDCHNRPTHVFDKTPKDAVNRGFWEGLLDPSVPYLHSVAVPLMDTTAVSREGAEAYFLRGLREGYAKSHPEAKVSEESLVKASRALAGIYRFNIYPHMRIKWDTYQSQLGHGGMEMRKEGCYRCHGSHESAQGETVTEDCDNCHSIVQTEEAPASLPEHMRHYFPEPERAP